MEKVRIGKVRFSVDGVWNSSTASSTGYSLLATVTNEAMTKVYASLKDNNKDTLDTDTSWRLILDAETAVNNATKKEIVTKTASDTTPSIEPNKMYEFPTMASLDITLSGQVADVLNEWQFSFDSGSTATTFSVPSGVVWTSAVSIAANTHYEVNIVYNQQDQTYYGIIVGWDIL